MSINSMVVEALRHGETTAGHCYLGVTDALLTPFGVSQMEEALHGLSAKDYDCVITSPLRRCADFAKEWAGLSCPVAINPNFQEFNFGDWDGLTAKKIMALWPGQLEQFWQNPLVFTPPNGETLSHFFKRVGRGLQSMQATADHRVLLITHGGVIKAIHCILHDKPASEMFAVEVKHASLHRLIG
ncbi:histidine phosphatase family protein [Neptunomonas phycophila]|uniref:Histidine phosphatase family protein n=1 Tax=Neptunomonas phycophila TaxID=1572645 RepID=A0AAW7XDS9_9GAMM|nr:histidine phosphatase family protein [Neptunomonas phycophila]MDO6452339.1 histidine phosphatase family protein [Neptunomonas phycophila]